MIQQQIKIERLAANPLIAPGDVQPSFPDWEVLGVFNAGVAQYGDEVILLLRVADAAPADRSRARACSGAERGAERR